MRISFSYVFDSYNVNYRAFVRTWKISGSHTITNPAHLLSPSPSTFGQMVSCCTG